jgi:hypothetical protein
MAWVPVTCIRFALREAMGKEEKTGMLPLRKLNVRSMTLSWWMNSTGAKCSGEIRVSVVYVRRTGIALEVRCRPVFVN